MHLVHDCPFCLTTAAGFAGTGNAHFPHPKDSGRFLVPLRCQACGMCVIADCGGQYVQHWINGQPQIPEPAIEEVWPKPPPLEAPQHTPGNPRRYYLQGLNALRRDDYDAAGTMFRKCLDSALKALAPGGKGTLQQRIDKLPASTGVTDAMKEWAHVIREDGNDAAHEDDPFERNEAELLQSFTELFLTYAFSLPGMLEQRKAVTTPAGSAAS